MTRIFIACSPADSSCAGQIQRDLAAADYVVWQEKPEISPGSASYPRMIETGIRSAAVIVVVWSGQAAQDEWIEREILFAQRLKKPIVPVVVDGTELPITLINVPPVAAGEGCGDVLEQLRPHLPPPDSDDILLALLEQLAHDHIRERKAGIERAAELLENEKYREEVLALLEDVARTDLISGVREAAQAVLDRRRQRGKAPALREEKSRHVFGVRCAKGHITYFDKRMVCPDSGTFPREIVRRAGQELNDIRLKCGEPGCDEIMVVPVDCEGYK